MNLHNLHNDAENPNGAAHHCVHFILYLVVNTYMNIPLINCNIGLSVQAAFFF